jgi:1,4-dihydroxy-2-naphthoyl-CoA hydrolase
VNPTSSGSDGLEAAESHQPPPAAEGVEMPTWLRDLSAGTLAERMGIVFTEIAAKRLVARMPVEGNTQPYGLLHGGASAVLAETLGSIGAQLSAGPGAQALGIELSCTHHRAVRNGYVTGVAAPIHVGRTVATYEIVITDDGGRRVCTSRLTCLLRQGGD